MHKNIIGYSCMMPIDYTRIEVYNNLTRSNNTDQQSNWADNTHKSVSRTCEPMKAIDRQVMQRLLPIKDEKEIKNMCANMQEFQTVSEKLFELEQRKAIKKKEMDALEKEIKQLKSETSSYMKKRQKNELTVAGLTVLFTAYAKPTFDKEAFIAGEKDGEQIYNKYLRRIPMERVTVRIAKV